jgi:hypothetical protein
MSILNSNSISCNGTVRLPQLNTAQRNALTDVELGTIIINIDTQTLQVYRETGWATLGNFGAWNATGGTIISSGGVNYHVFTAPGTFTINSFRTSAALNIFMVAGGGGGGQGSPTTGHAGGGGGAGEILQTFNAFRYIGSILVTVGDGGISRGPTNLNGSGGNTSITYGTPTPTPLLISTITAVGGGGGGVGNPTPVGNIAGQPGGSGGGGGRTPGVAGNPGLAPLGTTPFTADGATWSRFNYAGGASSPPGGGGGGGGAGFTGSNATTIEGGFGGPARAFPQFPAPLIGPAIPAPVRPVWLTAVGPTGNYAGGGGGGENAAPGAVAAGGGGGAGSGAEFPGVFSTAAVSFTGSGGGGGTTAPVVAAGNGGSGIVIFSYPTI